MVSEGAHQHAGTAVTMATSSDASGGDGSNDSVPASLPRVGKRGAPQAFARKLFEILTTESQAVIAWNGNGTAFHVKDVDAFSEDTLTKYYRHSKFSSFQRQLNLYSFRKIVKGPDAGGYAHPMFRRDRPDDLYHVRRSISGSARYEPAAHVAAKAAAAAARRVAATSGSTSKAAGGDCAAPKRAHKSSGAARRFGKVRGGVSGKPHQRAVSEENMLLPDQRSGSAEVGIGNGMADLKYHQQALQQQNQQRATAAAATAGDAPAGVGADGLAAAWTSGESSDSDVSVKEAPTEHERDDDDEDDEDDEEREGEDGPSDESDNEIGDDSRDASNAAPSADTIQVAQSKTEPQETQPQARHGAQRIPHQEARSGIDETAKASAGVAHQSGGRAGGGSPAQGGAEVEGRRSIGRAGNSSPSTKRSPFNFFKKTFSFMDRSSSHGRSMSSSSFDMTATEASPTQANTGTNSTADVGTNVVDNDDISPLMVDTSAAARAAAAGTAEQIVRPPPVSVGSPGNAGSGGGSVRGMGEAGNKMWTTSPLTPKSSIEAAAMAATATATATAAAEATAAMPPPPKREQREELGLVEQLTNMVEVFDICDLLRKVSTSNSSRLDKNGGIVKPAQPQHLRNMSVDTDQGLPQSPQSRDGQAGLGSLASMELVRDSSKDWDTLMAGSADVGDLSNTMVQSVAEFFSF